jgi:tetratricopeptide (TPR) repeat protein
MTWLDVLGSVAGVLALGVGAWQLRVAVLDRRDAGKGQQRPAGDADAAGGTLSVTAPVGRLPAEVLGRGALLAELRSALGGVKRRRPGTWVLAGMGGVGKSTIALRCAADARARGWPAWWVNAADPVSLHGGILEILRLLGAPGAIQREVQDGAATAADRFWSFLDGGARRGVLVFDNADLPAVLAGADSARPGDGTGWVRAVGGILVLVTTRAGDPGTWGTWCQVRPLGVLDDDTAAAVLRGLAPQVPDPGGRESLALARRLGGLPLALHLAGTYLASPFARWRGFGGYLQALDSAVGPQALADLDPVPADSRNAVSRTWELSLDALAAQGLGQARQVLYSLSCLAPATPVPQGMLRPDGRTVPALRGLAGLGLISVQPGMPAAGPYITVHPVVAGTCRLQILSALEAGGSAAMTEATRMLAAAAGELDSERPGDRAAWELLVPHVAAAMSWMPPHLETDDLIRLLRVGRDAFSSLWGIGAHQSRDSEILARANVAAAERLGSEHPESLAARHDLAVYLSDTGKPAEAEAIFRAVLTGRREILGEDHIHTLVTRDRLNGTVMEQGRFGEAEQLYRQLAADMARVLGPEHPETLATSVDLAWSVGMQGRPGEAAGICRQSLEAERRILGHDHPRTLDAWDDLSRWTSEEGGHAAAEQMCRELLAIELRTMGPDHQLALTTRGNLAKAIAGQGRLGEAEISLRELLTTMERVLTARHQRTITVRRYLADTVAAQGRAEEAAELYRGLLEIQQRELGHGHPDTRLTQQLLIRLPITFRD